MESEAQVWVRGVTKWFNVTKGWGFINVKKDDDGESIGGEAECKSESEAKSEGKTEGELKSISEAKSEDGAKSECEADTKIKCDETTKCEDTESEPCGDIFVHQSVIQREGFRSLGEGEEVEFQAFRFVLSIHQKFHRINKLHP